MNAAALLLDPQPPPGEDELPHNFGDRLESKPHHDQAELIYVPLDRHVRPQGDIYVASNMAIYYSELQVTKNDFRGPDLFVVLGTTRRPRKSWVVWQEENTPNVVVELLSDKTRHIDPGIKKLIYARSMSVAEYFLYDPWREDSFEGFYLDINTKAYVLAPVLPGGDVVSRVLGLRLGPWEGEFLGETRRWIRWKDLDGVPIPTDEELAANAALLAEEEALRADEAARRADEAVLRADTAEDTSRRLAAERDALLEKLRKAGIEP